MTAWRCTSCGQPVDLADARAHYDRCAGGDHDPDNAADDHDEDTTT